MSSFMTLMQKTVQNHQSKKAQPHQKTHQNHQNPIKKGATNNM
jgi:hypothetical protein